MYSKKKGQDWFKEYKQNILQYLKLLIKQNNISNTLRQRDYNVNVSTENRELRSNRKPRNKMKKNKGVEFSLTMASGLNKDLTR